ncbi:peroxynitrite isomerase THAP4 [Orycteropus afer afer]|uniref:Peroxynitrite isomerase THAP4 n=1 Tax=Orycteropus afer afer TaxID=1230840 RepID=A0A8B7A0J0_ORYAF|nr:peroxynitrite isomerase THAP4 [Orycteropus afer afer]
MGTCSRQSRDPKGRECGAPRARAEGPSKAFKLPGQARLCNRLQPPKHLGNKQGRASLECKRDSDLSRHGTPTACSGAQKARHALAVPRHPENAAWLTSWLRGSEPRCASPPTHPRDRTLHIHNHIHIHITPRGVRTDAKARTSPPGEPTVLRSAGPSPGGAASAAPAAHNAAVAPCSRACQPGLSPREHPASNSTRTPGTRDSSRTAFPLKDSKRLLQWLKAVQRDNWTPTKYSFLCSEHFTKDSFSRRLEDQHRLLKPTAVPSIFHLAEKRGPGGHGSARRKERTKAPGAVRGRPGGADSQGALPASPSSHTSLSAKLEPKKPKQVAGRGAATSGADHETLGPAQVQPSRARTSEDSAASTKAGSQREAEAVSVDAGDESSGSADGVTEKSCISVDDFSPPASGARRFIGSLHSYSFSSRHTRERPPAAREQVERKRPKRDAEPSGSSPGPDKGSAHSLPSSSLTATPQKPSQSPSASPADVTPQPAAEAVQSEQVDASPMSINEVILSASGACRLIDSLHSYCFSSRQNKSQVCCLREQVEKKNGELKSLRQRVSRSDSQVRKLREKLDELQRAMAPNLNGLLPPSCEPPTMNPMVEPLSWMLGTWLSDPPGAGTFPTLHPFQYLEEAHISHVGQPVLNFSFNAFHPDTRKPMHRECGFIRLQPDTNKVAFISAQNTGIVEVEEGEVNGQELCIASHSIARISFAKEPHVEQITRKFRLNSEGKLEQTVSMATSTQPMTQHLHITYKKVTP